jgi:hypothetical protein
VEFRVYGKTSRFIIAIFAAPMLAVAAGLFVFLSAEPAGGMQPGIYLVMAMPAMTTLLLTLLLSVTMGVRIRIERPEGAVYRIHALLGYELRRKRFALADFQRVSLYRTGRGGYHASLIGRDEELICSFSASLKEVRETAERVAAECGLKVTDHL